MPVGRKTGGRVKGTPNHHKAALQARLAVRFPEYNPVIEMAVIANAMADNLKPYETAKNEDLRSLIDAHDKVAQYLTPKLKAIEMSGADGSPLVIKLIKDDLKL